MKKVKFELLSITTCIMLTTCSNAATCQNEYFEGNPEWWIQSPGFGFTFLSHYEIVSDSVINGLVYKKMVNNFQSNQQLGHDCGDYYCHLIRSQGNRIYNYNVELGAEELLYAFEGDVGDTLFSHPLISSPYDSITTGFLILELDSILISDEWRNYYVVAVESNFTNQTYPGIIIEGIGSFGGLFQNLPSSILNGIQCFSYNGITYYEQYTTPYPTLIQGNCNFDNVIELENSWLEVFPNPLEDNITVKSNANIPISNIKVFDAVGRKVFEEKVFYPNQTWNLSTLSDGVYVMSVELESGQFISERIVKQ